MRINVYNEEIPPSRPRKVQKTADTGKTFYGLRIYLMGSSELHRTENDNDESAITFWFDTKTRRQHFCLSLLDPKSE